MKFFFVVLFVFAAPISYAQSMDDGNLYASDVYPDDTIVKTVDLEVLRLSPSDRAIVDKIKDTLNRANEKELDRLRIKIKSDPAWKITDETQRAFWQEVINIAHIHLRQNDRLTLYLMMGYYSLANHTKVDEECARNITWIKSTFADAKFSFHNPHEDCRREDPVAVARFEQALAYFYVVYCERYKCHCENEGEENE